jgi:hypothetical protein
MMLVLKGTQILERYNGMDVDITASALEQAVQFVQTAHAH